MSLRATHAVVDLKAMRHNLTQLKSIMPSDCSILAVVKGNAYGLGAVHICQMLERFGVAYLGVAALSEAVELRNAGINSPIMIFTEAFIEEYAELLRHDVTQTVFSFEKAHELDIVAGATGNTSRIHLKVDTGMGRVGCRYEDALGIALRIKNELQHTFLEGLYTHFPVAEEPEENGNVEFTRGQVNKIRDLIARLRDEDISIPYVHCANTGGILNYPESAFNLVRLGISMYGCHPSAQGRKLQLENVVTFRTKVIYVKRVPAGTCISYGRKYITEKDTTIATLPVGYADGYPRGLSNRGRILIHGRDFPVAGRVCMDMLMVDVGDVDVKVGDEAVLYGRQKDAFVSLETVASMLDTIPYEVICRIAPRVPRLHVGIEGIDT